MATDGMASSYACEIAHIMHGLGDGSKQNLESAHLIEEIVGQQMNSLLQQAHEVSISRSSNSIGLPEILFLMRKDKVKLVRLLKHLSFKDSLSSTMSSAPLVLPAGVSSGRGFVDLGSLVTASPHSNQVPTAVAMTISGNSALPAGSLSSSMASNLVSSSCNIPPIVQHHVALVSSHVSHEPATIASAASSFGNQDHPSFLPPSSSGSSEQTTAASSGGSSGTGSFPATHQLTNHDHEDVRSLHQATKRLKICMDFLRSSLDESGGQLIRAFSDDFFDEIKHKRALRREKMTRNMTEQEYMRFHQSRQVSFASKSRPNKFREWLSLQCSTRDWQPDNLRINDFAIEVLQYLAYETVAEIVDLCLLVKQDSQKHANDPVHNLVRSVRHPLAHRRPSYDVMMDDAAGLKRRRQNEGPEETAIDCIQPIHVREVARRFLTPSAVFTIGQRLHQPLLKRLIPL